MKSKKRHQWKFRDRYRYTLPRERTPAICMACGAKHWYVKRPKKQPSAARAYGPNTEDFVYQSPGVQITVAPRPVPACVPGR